MLDAVTVASLLIWGSSILAVILIYWVWLCADKGWSFLMVISLILFTLWVLLVALLYLE
jgi:hypothetical protein